MHFVHAIPANNKWFNNEKIRQKAVVGLFFEVKKDLEDLTFFDFWDVKLDRAGEE